MDARVASMSGTLSFTIRNEFTAATTSATRSASPIEVNVDMPYHTNIVITSDVAKVAVDPTERSNPFTVRDIVTPIAITVTIDIPLSIVVMLLIVRNVVGMSAPNSAIRNTIVITVPHLLMNSMIEFLFFLFSGFSTFIVDSITNVLLLNNKEVLLHLYLRFQVLLRFLRHTSHMFCQLFQGSLQIRTKHILCPCPSLQGVL